MFSKEEFNIPGTDEQPIIGDITYSNSYPDYLIIFVHGFKGFKDWGTHQLTANFFANKGIYFLKFNFSHSGVLPDNLSDITDLELFSKNTPSKELYDLDQVISFAKNKFPYLQIVLLGHSRGGALSILQTAKDKRVKKLITWASIGAFRNLWKEEEEEPWRKNGVKYIINGRTKQQMPLDVALLNDVITNEKEFDLKAAVAAISIPILFIQGEKDPAVKVEVAKEFHLIQTSTLLLVEEGDHVFGASHPYKKDELPKDLENICEACANFIIN
jgi:fermentation-respiration switch protein FrsA (DUF1100 family)